MSWPSPFALDRRSLAAFRVGLGLLLLGDLLIRSTDLTAHYTDLGIMPRNQLTLNYGRAEDWSLYLFNGTPTGVGLLFALAAAAAILLMLGWQTRLMTVTSWVLTVSLANRNPLVEHGADVILRMMLFWGMFLPLGDVYSLDRRRQKTAPIATNNAHTSAASAALLIQVICIYWFTVLLKTGTAWRAGGTAVYYLMAANQYTSALGVRLLPLLRSWPWLGYALTWSSFYTEILAPLLLLLPITRLRSLALVMLLALHLGIAACLNLGLFPWADLVTLLPFVPGAGWDRAVQALPFRRRTEGTVRLSAESPEQLPLPPNDRSSVYHRVGRHLRTAAVLAALAVILAFNVSTIESSHFTMPARLYSVARVLRLDQTWSMFTPTPIEFGGWMVAVGHTTGGKEVDAFNPGQPLSWDKPSLVSDAYRNERWRLVLTAASYPIANSSRELYAAYLCRLWNAADSPGANGEHLAGVDLIFMHEETRADFKESVPVKRPLQRYACGIIAH